MSVAFDAVSSAVSTANGATSVTHNNLTIGAGANRALVVQVAFSTTVTNLGMRWDNGGTPQSLAAITGATATSTCNVQLWGLVNPTAGNKTLKVGDASGGSWTTAADVTVCGISYTGVDQTGGVTSFPHGTSATATSGTNTGAVTVTSAVGNAVVGVFATNDAAMSSVDNTQTFIDNVPATMSTAGNRAAGAATVTLTATRDATSHVASAGADILADAGGGGLTVAQEIPAIYQAMSGCIIGRVDA